MSKSRKKSKANTTDTNNKGNQNKSNQGQDSKPKNVVKTNVVKTKKVEKNKEASSYRSSRQQVDGSTLLFGKQNYMLILLSFGLITLGMLLMMGGHMPSRDVWDESLIYSARRTLLAPFVILCGLVVGFFAIFRK